MSRAYRVRQAEASARVEGGDSLALSLCLLDILDPEAMRALLREELLGAGWVPDAEGRPSAAIEDATATLDGDEVLLRIGEVREVRAQGDDREAAERALRGAVKRAESSVTRDASQRLLRLETALRDVVGEVVQRVYVRALKRRAASLGRVEAVDERVGDDGELELTIKVRV